MTPCPSCGAESPPQFSFCGYCGTALERAEQSAAPAHETRTARFAESEGMEEKRAVKELSESDKGRAVYLERFYDVKNEQPTDYDLVLNTEKLGTDAAAALIAAAVGAPARRRSGPSA